MASNNKVSNIYSKFNFMNKINEYKSLAIIENFQFELLILYLLNLLIILIFRREISSNLSICYKF